MAKNDTQNTHDTLAAALGRHGITLPEDQVALLDRYCALLWEWNEKINLTRHTDFEKFVTRDVVDSLAFAGVLAEGERVLDVGTGGGVPGVILAIVRPDLRVTMCESTGKKARVVEDIVAKLGIKAKVQNARAEAILDRVRYDSLVIRAVAPLKTLLEWFKPHWPAFSRLLILKGPSWVEERGEARHFGLMHGLALRKVASYPLPGTESESVLLSIAPDERRKKPTPPAAKKKPARNFTGRKFAKTGRGKGWTTASKRPPKRGKPG